MMNLWHEIGSGKKSPDVVNVVIQMPKETKNTYTLESDGKISYFRLENVMHSPVFYNGDYGFIPKTYADFDAGPLYCLVLTNEKTFPGCVVPARPIGALEYTQNARPHRMIIAVPEADESFNDKLSIDDLTEDEQKEIKQFFMFYKQIDGTEIEAIGFREADTAKKIVEHAKRVYGERNV